MFVYSGLLLQELDSSYHDGNIVKGAFRVTSAQLLNNNPVFRLKPCDWNPARLGCLEAESYLEA